jgi:hypothetical protein
MSEASKDNALLNTLGEATRLLDEMQRLRAQAEEHLKAAELAHKNADSEGLFAFNAKRTCEEHSSAIAALKGTAESETSSITTNRQKSEDSAAAITNLKATIESSSKAITEIRNQVQPVSAELATAVKTASERVGEIQVAKQSAHDLAEETSNLAASAAKALASAESGATASQEAAQKAAGYVSTITEDQKDARASATEAAASAAATKEEHEKLAPIIEHLNKSDEIVRGFEKHISELSDQLEGLIQKVEGLLPRAASASLASSFITQRSRFKSSQKWWVIAFVACISGLVAVSAPSFFKATFGDKPLAWEEVLRGLTARLPVVIPLVWLAIYAGRNYMLALRLEEDYAYKESISVAFEGYKRELKEIASGDSQTPLTMLCACVLRAISERPGRIYDGKHQDITPANELQTALNQVQELARKKIAT